MRYCVLCRTIDLAEIEAKCRVVGAINVKVAPRVKQVFCDLTSEQADKLLKQSLKVKEVKITKTVQILAPVIENQAVQEAEFNISHVFNDFRGAFIPPLTGVGHTVAVLDTGIRKTHEALIDKVIYEEDFSDSETCDDIYGHGSSTAYLIAGGTHGSRNSGVAPDAKLINLKCLGNDGEGTDEMLINAIDKACDLVEAARNAGKPLYDPSYPNVLNISVGASDDGDSENPVRVACQAAVDEYGLQIVASAGNGGDRPSTVLLPAVDEKVVAVGGIYSGALQVWEQSSRGPTKEGLVKPDWVCWATNIHVADNAADNAYTTKSGTSFSAPILSGMVGLVWELGRRSFGSPWTVTLYDIGAVGEMIGAKPEDAPIHKDNSYGYGLPALQPLVRGATSAVAAPTSDVMSMAMLMMIMMSMTGG